MAETPSTAGRNHRQGHVSHDEEDVGHDGHGQQERREPAAVRFAAARFGSAQGLAERLDRLERVSAGAGPGGLAREREVEREVKRRIREEAGRRRVIHYGLHDRRFDAEGLHRAREVQEMSRLQMSAVKGPNLGKQLDPAWVATRSIKPELFDLPIDLQASPRPQALFLYTSPQLKIERSPAGGSRVQEWLLPGRREATKDLLAAAERENQGPTGTSPTKRR